MDDANRMTNEKQVKSNVKELLIKYGMDQRQLAELTGLSVRTVSELVNDKTLRYPKKAIEAIASALDIDDINEIITLVDDYKTKG